MTAHPAHTPTPSGPLTLRETQQESRAHEDAVDDCGVSGQAGHVGEAQGNHGPTDGRDRNHLLSTHPVAKIASQHLRDRVAPEEHTQHQTLREPGER